MPVRRRLLRDVLLLLAAVALVDGFWLEPRKLLFREDVRLELGAAPLRLVHLSDLHIARETEIERRLLAAVAAAKPDAIVISGDMVADTHAWPRLASQSRAARAVLAELRRVAPIYAVQGHSEYWGYVVAELHASGLEWLSNEGRLLGSERGVLLLGLNQQAGRDAQTPNEEPRFLAMDIAGEQTWGRDRTGFWNHYTHFDPFGGDLAEVAGPLTWTAYEATCDVWFGGEDAEGGLAVLSRYPLGEDRMMVFRRSGATSGAPLTFMLVAHGTAPRESALGQTGADSGVRPRTRRWYRMRVRAEAGEHETRVEARAWPADEAEPGEWQARVTDDGPLRHRAGTVGLWARTGVVAYRNLEVRTLDGSLLLRDALESTPDGFHDGPRGTRLGLALARSPRVAAGTPRIVLSHVPDVIREAAARGLEAVLGGHTHGGQVRLPGGIALVTRTSLGPHYDKGLFDVSSSAPGGRTRLFINSGVGTSLLPVRFLTPPSFAVVEVGRSRPDD